MSLESLDDDIQFHLLCQLDCIQSLSNLIRASPIHLDAFTRDKELILSEVLKQIIARDVLPDAISAVHAMSVHDFVNRHNQYVWPHQPIPLDISMPLCRFSRTLQYFVDNYSRESSVALREFVGVAAQRGRKSSLRPNGWRKGLSVVEKGRIQRAFCRVECFVKFCVLGFNTPHNNHDSYAPQLLKDLALLLGPWEIEEMACVRDYIRMKLMRLFREMETDFVQEHGFTPKRPEGDVGSTIDWMQQHIFFSDASKDLHHELCVEFLLAHGLQNLRRLFTSQKQDSKNNILSLCGTQFCWMERGSNPDANTPGWSLHFVWSRYFLARALSHRPVMIVPLVQQEIDAINDNSLNFDGDKLSSRNEAWVWSKEYVRSAVWSCAEAYHLRRWGYVFWDHSRLKAAGLSKMTRREVAEKCLVSRDTQRELSAQERLEGATKGVYQLVETWLYQYGVPRT